MTTFSAHADEPGLLDFIGKMDVSRLKSIFLVHGEPGPQAALTTALNRAGFADVRSPTRGMTVELA
jgi:metallo-beta-lactamase family protein